MELAVLLLCHTFHSDIIQCVILPDTLIPDKPNDTIHEKQMIHVKEEVSTLLCIVYKDKHFAVVKVHLKDQRVTVWDSAINDALDCAEREWLPHIAYLIHVHFPKKFSMMLITICLIL